MTDGTTTNDFFFDICVAISTREVENCKDEIEDEDEATHGAEDNANNGARSGTGIEVRIDGWNGYYTT